MAKRAKTRATATSTSERTARWFALQRLITHIKMYQGRDNGAGIPPEKINDIFQQLFQPDRLGLLMDGPGFNARKIQHLVNQSEQPLARAIQQRDLRVLLRLKLRLKRLRLKRQLQRHLLDPVGQVAHQRGSGARTDMDTFLWYLIPFRVLMTSIPRQLVGFQLRAAM